MRPDDVRNLIRFNTRMGMFVCSSNQANLVAFLTGYEYAAAGECRFTEALGRHLAGRHRVEPDALGWPHQIARLAERRVLDWVDVYLLVSSEVSNAAVGTEAEAERIASPVAGPEPRSGGSG